MNRRTLRYFLFGSAPDEIGETAIHRCPRFTDKDYGEEFDRQLGICKKGRVREHRTAAAVRRFLPSYALRVGISICSGNTPTAYMG
jgi:hypothetical protein